MLLVRGESRGIPSNARRYQIRGNDPRIFRIWEGFVAFSFVVVITEGIVVCFGFLIIVC